LPAQLAEHDLGGGLVSAQRNAAATVGRVRVRDVAIPDRRSNAAAIAVAGQGSDDGLAVRSLEAHSRLALASDALGAGGDRAGVLLPENGGMDRFLSQNGRPRLARF
jgi:hypothetical protein